MKQLKKVLIVEPDERQAQLGLEGFGCIVNRCVDIAEVLEKVRNNWPVDGIVLAHKQLSVHNIMSGEAVLLGELAKLAEEKNILLLTHEARSESSAWASSCESDIVTTLRCGEYVEKVRGLDGYFVEEEAFTGHDWYHISSVMVALLWKKNPAPF